MEEGKIKFKYNFSEIIDTNLQIENEYKILIENAFYKKNKIGDKTDKIRVKPFSIFSELYNRFKIDPFGTYSPDDFPYKIMKEIADDYDKFKKSLNSYHYRINDLLDEFYYKAPKEIGKTFNAKFRIKIIKKEYYLQVEIDGKNYRDILNEKLYEIKEREKQRNIDSEILENKIRCYIENIITESKNFLAVNYTPSDVIDRSTSNRIAPSHNLMSVATDQSANEIGSKISVLEGIEKYSAEHVLLSGQPGSGKTTALKNFLLKKAKDAQKVKQAPVPVMISMRYFRTSIEDLITTTLDDQYGIDLNKNEISYLIKNQRLFFLIDGINEAPFQKALDELSDFIIDNIDCSIVLAARKNTRLGSIGVEICLELLPLTYTQISEYVLKCLPDNHRDFLFKLDDRTKGLAKTPMFLSMLIRSYNADNVKAIPTNLGEAFSAFTDNLIGQLKSGIRITHDEKMLWNNALQEIAFKMIEGNDPKFPSHSMTKKDAIKTISLITSSEENVSNRILSNLLDHSLIQANSGGDIGFSHQLIQEFFAAGYILRHVAELSDTEIRTHYLNYTKWTEPISIMVSLTNDFDFVCRIIDLSASVDTMLAAQIAGSVKDSFRKEIIERIIPLCATTASKIYAFLRIGGEDAIDYIFPMLRYDLPWVVGDVIKLLTNTGNDKAIKYLSYLINKSTNTSNKKSAIKALGKIGNRQQINLIEPLLEDDNREIRCSAALALSEINGKNVLEYIDPILKQENDSYRSLRIIREMRRNGINTGSDCLIDILKDKDTEKSLITDAIDELGELKDERAIDILTSFTSDSNAQIQLKAIVAIGKLGIGDSAEKMLQLLHEWHDDPYMINEILVAIWEIADGRATDHLIALLKTEKRDLYQVTMIAYSIAILGRIGDRKAAAHIRPFLAETAYPLITLAATEALFSFNEKISDDAVVSLLEHRDMTINNIATNLLIKIGDEGTLAKLKRYTDVEYDFNLKRAIESLQDKCGIYDPGLQ